MKESTPSVWCEHCRATVGLGPTDSTDPLTGSLAGGLLATPGPDHRRRRVGRARGIRDAGRARRPVYGAAFPRLGRTRDGGHPRAAATPRPNEQHRDLRTIVRWTAPNGNRAPIGARLRTCAATTCADRREGKMTAAPHSTWEHGAAGDRREADCGYPPLPVDRFIAASWTCASAITRTTEVAMAATASGFGLSALGAAGHLIRTNGECRSAGAVRR